MYPVSLSLLKLACSLVSLQPGMVNLNLKEEDNFKELVNSLFSLQEERVFIYNEFDIKFKEYLLDAPKFNHERLKLICKSVSEQLNEVNAKILKLKDRATAVAGGGVKECRLIVKQIEKLQANEETKFKLVRSHLGLYLVIQINIQNSKKRRRRVGDSLSDSRILHV